MGSAIIIARKEIKELYSNRGTFLMNIVLTLFFSVFRALGMAGTGGLAARSSLDSAIFFLAAAIGLFTTYISTSQVFLLEKRESVIETLLCAPVTLRQIWLGKVLAVTALAYLLSLLTVAVILVITNIMSDSLLLPSATTIVYVLLGIPAFLAAFTGLLGFAQLRLGMRENRIINFVIFVPAFAVLYSFGLTFIFAVSWAHIGIIFGVSTLLLAITAYVTGHLSKERIVTTLA